MLAALLLAVPGGPRLSAAGEAASAPRPSLAESKARAALEVMALGRDLFQRGQYRGAAIEFEKALQIDPQNSVAAGYLKLCEKKLEGR